MLVRNGVLGRKALAALGAAAGENIAAANRRHAGAEAVAALADELGRLIGTLHVRYSVLGRLANDSNYMTGKTQTCPERMRVPLQEFEQAYGGNAFRSQRAEAGLRTRVSLLDAAAPINVYSDCNQTQGQGR